MSGPLSHTDFSERPIEPGRILIVDDQEYNIQAIKIILHYSLGVNTDEIADKASNGQEAINAIQANLDQNMGNKCDYSLILMDCNMPIVDGYEATA